MLREHALLQMVHHFRLPQSLPQAWEHGRRKYPCVEFCTHLDGKRLEHFQSLSKT
jgi:hypothetical protein